MKVLLLLLILSGCKENENCFSCPCLCQTQAKKQTATTQTVTTTDNVATSKTAPAPECHWYDSKKDCEVAQQAFLLAGNPAEFRSSEKSSRNDIFFKPENNGCTLDDALSYLFVVRYFLENERWLILACCLSEDLGSNCRMSWHRPVKLF